MIVTKNKLNSDSCLVVLICILSFSVFIFTTDGHRYTFDEDNAEQQTLRMATGQPTPGYIPGVSKINFEYPLIFPDQSGPACINAIICSQSYVGHSATETPFVFINHYLHIITNNTMVLTTDDFDDPNYVYWRNSLNPDLTFLELFYGPIFSALSVGIFFLISRSFDFSQKNSIMLALLFALTTIAWAYSKTSLNVVPAMFFDLLGFLFFRRYRNSGKSLNLVYSGISFGFSFQVRPDAILFIAPLFFFILVDLRQKTAKIKKLFSFIIPVIGSYVIYMLTNFIRDGTTFMTSFTITGQSIGATYVHTPTPLPLTIFGQLFSPGIGLFVFCPILLTTFFAFFDFYKKNKKESFLFLAFVIIFLIYYGRLDAWHGLVAWGPRYLLEVTPFLLLPLGASLGIRKNISMKVALIGLAILGFFFNLVFMIQDAIFFVWCLPSCNHGLFSIGTESQLWINTAILWTFKFSPLTQTILVAFTHLQPDIYLLKLLGMKAFIVSLVVMISPQVYLLYRIFRKQDSQLRPDSHNDIKQ